MKKEKKEEKLINVMVNAMVGDDVYVIASNKYQLKAPCPVCGGAKKITTIDGGTVPCCPDGQIVYTATRYYYIKQKITKMTIINPGHAYEERIRVTTDAFEKLGIRFRPDDVVVVDKGACGFFHDDGGERCGRELMRDSDHCTEYFVKHIESIMEGREHIICLTEDRAAHICRVMMENEKEKLDEHNALSGSAFVWPWDGDIKAYETVDSNEFIGKFRNFKDVETKKLVIHTPVAPRDSVFRVIFSDEEKKFVVRRNTVGLVVKINEETASVAISCGSDTLKDYEYNPSEEYIRSMNPLDYSKLLFGEYGDAAFARDIISGEDRRTIELRF